MQFPHSLLTQRRGFIAGLIVASALSCSVAVAAPAIEQAITVTFPNLTMKFNGVTKAPPADQRPIMYNGRTYVPLRFVSEAMGHPVEWDGRTETIYVGARPEKSRPSVLLTSDSATNRQWGYARANFGPNLEEVSSVNAAIDALGQDRENALLVTTGRDPWLNAVDWIEVEDDFVLNGKYKTLTGTIFPGSLYKGVTSGAVIGYVVVEDENGKTLYKSGNIKATGYNDDVKFSVDVTGVGMVKMWVVTYPEVGPGRKAQIGIENFGLN